MALVTPAGAAAPAAPPPNQVLQAQIDEQLRLAPGGKQISTNEISWNNGTVVMAFPLPGEKAAPVATNSSLAAAADGNVNGCPFGDVTRWFCFYDGTSFTGRRLQFASCGTQNFDPYAFRDRTESWVNTKRFTTVDVYNYTGSGGTFVRLWREPANAKSTVTSAPNRADFFTHNC